MREQFLHTELAVVLVKTNNINEARDLFVRLQAGMPLNAQEKRDAWPGEFTDYILKLGGKPNIARYPGHDFFNLLMKANRLRDRGKVRQVAAQIAMQFVTRRRSNGERFCDISTKAIDDFYYQNLDFDASSADARRLYTVLDKVTELLRDQKRKKMQGHEAIHLVLLTDLLLDDYTRAWEADFASAFDGFRERLARATKTKNDEQPHEYWLRYGIHARTNSDRAATIRRRHEFFLAEMCKSMTLVMKDAERAFGPIEREILYCRDRKLCARCLLDGVEAEVPWAEAHVHHLHRHASGGRTTLDNGVLVHAKCHPQGREAEERFAAEWRKAQEGDS